MNVGLCQGCALSPNLFVVFMDRILWQGGEEGVTGQGPEDLVAAFSR